MGVFCEYYSEICEELLAHAELGGSIAAFRGKKRIAKRDWTMWLGKYSNFRESVDLAECVEFGFWEGIVLKSLDKTSALGFTEDIDGLSDKERSSLALTMLKQRSDSHYKATGSRLSDGAVATVEEDPTEFGSADVYEDVTLGD